MANADILSSIQLAAFRTQVLNAFDKVARIEEKINGRDALGSPTVSWTVVASSVPVMLKPLLRRYDEAYQDPAEQQQAMSRWLIFTTDVHEFTHKGRFVINDQFGHEKNYEIETDFSDRTFSVYRLFECVRID